MMLQWTENRFFLFHFKERTNKKYDMANMTIHRQPTLLLFHNSIWLWNPNYFKFSLPWVFFSISWTMTWLTLLSQEFQNYRSHPKRIFFFSFNNFSNAKTFFPRCNIPGLKMTCQWDWQVIFITDWEVLKV